MKIVLKKKYIEYIIMVILVVIAIFSKNILAYVTGSSVPLAVVEGYSMCPTLRKGDLVISYKPSPQDIHVGDVIIYKNPRGMLVIHRVIYVREDHGRYYYRTKGDNNPIPDPGWIPYERVEGKVITVGNGIVFKIPYFGYLSLWFHGIR